MSTKVTVMTNNNRIYYIWLSAAIGRSYAVYKELIDTFGSVFEIYRAEYEVYARLSSRVRRRIDFLSDKDLSEAVRISDYCRSAAISVITYEDEMYPALLREIEKPPLVLYVRGVIADFDSRLHVAVVGTRKMTEYGKCMAYNVGYSLAKNGATVVSGMALGCDSVAMCAALDAGYGCIGVLGGGVDIAYPPEHAGFMRNILSCGGTLISEYPPGEAPERDHFVERNRLISGLSRATLVVEADNVSGAMHTARFADAQGRSLYAIPGKIGEKSSEGTLALISGGARIALEANDILKEYVFLYRGTIDLKSYAALESEQIDQRLSVRGVRSRKAPSRHKAEHADSPLGGHRPERTGIRDVISSIVKKKETPSSEDKQKQQRIDSLPPQVREVYLALPKNQIFMADDVVNFGVSVQNFLYAVTVLEIHGLANSYPGSRFTLN